MGAPHPQDKGLLLPSASPSAPRARSPSPRPSPSTAPQQVNPRSPSAGPQLFLPQDLPQQTPQPCSSSHPLFLSPSPGPTGRPQASPNGSSPEGRASPQNPHTSRPTGPPQSPPDPQPAAPRGLSPQHPDPAGTHKRKLMASGAASGRVPPAAPAPAANTRETRSRGRGLKRHYHYGNRRNLAPPFPAAAPHARQAQPMGAAMPNYGGSPAPFPDILSLSPRPLSLLRHSLLSSAPLAATIGSRFQRGADPGCYISGRRGGALPDCSRVFSALVVPLLPWQPRSARSAPSARPLSGPAPAVCTSAHPGRTGPDPAVGTTGTLGMNGADPPAAAPRAAG